MPRRWLGRPWWAYDAVREIMGSGVRVASCLSMTNQSVMAAASIHLIGCVLYFVVLLCLVTQWKPWDELPGSDSGAVLSTRAEMLYEVSQLCEHLTTHCLQRVQRIRPQRAELIMMQCIQAGRPKSPPTL